MILTVFLMLCICFFYIKKQLLLKGEHDCKTILQYDCNKYQHIFFIVICIIFLTPYSIKNLSGLCVIVGLVILCVFFLLSKTFLLVEKKLIIEYNGFKFIIQDIKIDFDKMNVIFISTKGRKKRVHLNSKEAFESLSIELSKLSKDVKYTK